jgi:hypothetical protein
VSFVIILEEKISAETGRGVSLVDEKAMSLDNSPFRTVALLGAHVRRVLESPP